MHVGIITVGNHRPLHAVANVPVGLMTFLGPYVHVGAAHGVLLAWRASVLLPPRKHWGDDADAAFTRHATAGAFLSGAECSGQVPTSGTSKGVGPKERPTRASLNS